MCCYFSDKELWLHNAINQGARGVPFIIATLSKCHNMSKWDLYWPHAIRYGSNTSWNHYAAHSSYRLRCILLKRLRYIWTWLIIFVASDFSQSGDEIQIFRENTWWRRQMETFSALLAMCAGNSPVSGDFPTQRPVTRSFDVFFDLRLNKRLSKNGRAGDLRRYRAHSDVTVMIWLLVSTAHS